MPSAAAVMCTEHPALTPNVAAAPAFQPWPVLRPMTYIMSGPGVTFSSRPARTKRGRSWMPNTGRDRASGHRDEFLVALLLALELEELVVAATRAQRVFPTGAGPRLVDRALARLLVEHHAGRVEDAVLLVAQHPDLRLRVL